MGLFVVFLLHLLLVPVIHADYRCVCNYEVETRVYRDPNTSSDVIGYLYEFDCKPQAEVSPKGFLSLQYAHMLGYVDATQQISAQTCAGDAPLEDLLTTTPKPSTTTQTTVTSASTLKTTQTTAIPTTKTTTAVKTTNAPTTVSSKVTTTSSTTTTTQSTVMTTQTSSTTQTTMKQTTTRPTTLSTEQTTSPTTISTIKVTPPSTTMKPTEVQTTAPTKVPEGHIELCSNRSKTDIDRNGGFLGQYGLYCYEFVPYLTQWKNAERHCNLVSKGNLITINTQDEQDFVMRFLKTHKQSESIWIGLSDSNTEGTYEWSSGANVTFKNFQGISQHYTDHDHKLNDCVVIKSNGEWVDLPCGVPTLLGGGFGEAHSYICQYDLTSKPPDVFSSGYLSQFIIG